MLKLSRRIYYTVVPEEVRHGILVLRRTKSWLDAGILFIHVPKAAGVSINIALYGRFMGHLLATEIQRWGATRLKSLPSFAITRNPWDRVVSAYRFARAGRGIGGEQQAWVWKPEQFQAPEFESFDRFVKEWLAHKQVDRLDPIFRSQSLYICNERGKPLVDHVGRLENLQPTLAFIEKSIGRRPDIPQANRSGEEVDYRSFYTPELVDIVGEIYRRDIDNFGYGFE